MENPQPILAVTVSEACKLIGLGRSKIYEEIAAGRLLTRKAGQRTLIRVEDLKAYIDALPQGGLVGDK